MHPKEFQGSGCRSLPLAHSQEFQTKMETLQQRRDELERKEEKLKESLLKFDKFLKVSVVLQQTHRAVYVCMYGCSASPG